MADVIISIVVMALASQAFTFLAYLKFIDVIEGYHKRENSYLRNAQKIAQQKENNCEK